MNKIISLLTCIIVTGLTSCNSQSNSVIMNPNKEYNIQKADSTWKKELSEEQYYILRQKGTEYPFTGIYDKHFEKGHYHCAACDQVLFESENKYNSGCGWPAFSSPFDNANVVMEADTSHNMTRTEVLCSNCGGHLGHVFNDGPPPTGIRYCINSGALIFRKSE